RRVTIVGLPEGRTWGASENGGPDDATGAQGILATAEGRARHGAVRDGRYDDAAGHLRALLGGAFRSREPYRRELQGGSAGAGPRRSGTRTRSANAVPPAVWYPAVSLSGRQLPVLHSVRRECDRPATGDS